MTAFEDNLNGNFAVPSPSAGRSVYLKLGTVASSWVAWDLIRSWPILGADRARDPLVGTFWRRLATIPARVVTPILIMIVRTNALTVLGIVIATILQ